MRIILDGMGGDNAPAAVVEGAVIASKDIEHEIVIIGQEELINQELKKYKCHSQIIEALRSLEYIAFIDEIN